MTDSGSVRYTDIDNRQIGRLEFNGGMKSLELSVMLSFAST